MPAAKSPTMISANPTMFERFQHTLKEFLRLRWIILFAVGVITLRSLGILSNESALTLMLYKPALACIGMVAGHIAYSQCFYYIDMGSMIQNDEYMAVLGVCMLRGMIYAAFILGVTLGL